MERGHDLKRIRSVGITNQRETTVVWDKITGEPLNNAVVWADTRTTNLVRDLRNQEGSHELLDLCGLPLSTYPSSVKLIWLLENVNSVREAYDEGRLAFGTVDSWLIFKLNGGVEREGGPIHVTDGTNASRTMFMNLRTLQYDDRLLSFFGLDRDKIQLPKIVPSSDATAFGTLASGPLKGLPIAGCLGDQSSALVGQCGFQPGQAKNTYGTGCFLILNGGERAPESPSRLLTTALWQLGGEPLEYALEGSIFMAGAVVQWLRDGLGIIRDAAEVEKLASAAQDSGGVIFVPAMTGLGAPHWDPYARGTILGITRGTTAAHIARAALEGIALQVADVVEAMQNDSGVPLTELRVDGGAARNDLLMQLQADLLGVEVVRPEITETTALGAAYLAGLAAGVWPDRDTISAMWREDRRFEPRLAESERSELRGRWSEAIRRSASWASER